MIDFRLCNLAGATLPGGDFADTAGSSVTMTVNGGRTATLTASFDDPAAALVRPLSTVVKARWDQGPLITGAVVRPSYSGAQRLVTIPVRDPSLRLMAFQVGSSGTQFIDPDPDYDYGWIGVDQSEILARLVEHCTPTAAELAIGIPRNGIIRGNLPLSVNRDRAYEAGKQIWEAMQQLAAVIDGVDFDLRPLDQTDGSFAALDTYYPQMGTDRSESVVFEYGWGRHNCTECNIEPAGDLVRNRSWRVGQDSPEGWPTTGLVSNQDSMLTYGIYAEHIGEPDVLLQSTLNEHAYAAVTNYGFPPVFVTVTPAQDDGTGYRVGLGGVLVKEHAKYGSPPVLGPQGDYWLGDLVRIITRDGPAFTFDVKARILEITLTNAPNGAVVAGLRMAPLLGGGYRVRGVLPPTFAQQFNQLRQNLRMAQIVQ